MKESYRNKVDMFKQALFLDKRSPAQRQWDVDQAENTLRLDYPLSEDSIVFDVGSHIGDWAEKIINRYNPTMFLFEPVDEFCQIAKHRFECNPKVNVYPFGLSDKDECVRVIKAATASSIYINESKGTPEQSEFWDIHQFVVNNNILKIDLVKINIEGGEFRLLDRMIDTGLIGRCQNIQVQFHSFYPNAHAERDRIREQLSQTHSESYNYPFVWEGWRRREEDAK